MQIINKIRIAVLLLCITTILYQCYAQIDRSHLNCEGTTGYCYSDDTLVFETKVENNSTWGGYLVDIGAVSKTGNNEFSLFFRVNDLCKIEKLIYDGINESGDPQIILESINLNKGDSMDSGGAINIRVDNTTSGVYEKKIKINFTAVPESCGEDSRDEYTGEIDIQATVN